MRVRRASLIHVVNYNSLVFLPYGSDVAKMGDTKRMAQSKPRAETIPKRRHDVSAPTDDMQFLIDDVLDVGSVLGSSPTTRIWVWAAT